MQNKDYFKTKAISNSSLSYIEKQPFKFKQFMNGELEEKTTDYYQDGTAIHMYFLENDKFKKTYQFLDYTKPQSSNQIKFLEKINTYSKITDDRLITAYKNNYVNKLSEEKVLEKAKELRKENSSYLKYLKLSKNKVVLKPNLLQSLKCMEANIKHHNKASKLLSNELEVLQKNVFYYNELEIYWSNNNSNYKAMLDRLIVDNSNKVIKLVDIKTTKDVNNFEESFRMYKYDRQLAFYSLAIRELFKQKFKELNIEEYDIKFYILALDKITHRVEVFNISKNIILNSLKTIKELLNRIQWHTDNNKWEYRMEYYLNDGVIDICEIQQQDS